MRFAARAGRPGSPRRCAGAASSTRYRVALLERVAVRCSISAGPRPAAGATESTVRHRARNPAKPEGALNGRCDQTMGMHLGRAGEETGATGPARRAPADPCPAGRCDPDAKDAARLDHADQSSVLTDRMFVQPRGRDEIARVRRAIGPGQRVVSQRTTSQSARAAAMSSASSGQGRVRATGGCIAYPTGTTRTAPPLADSAISPAARRKASRPKTSAASPAMPAGRGCGGQRVQFGRRRDQLGRDARRIGLGLQQHAQQVRQGGITGLAGFVALGLGQVLGFDPALTAARMRWRCRPCAPRAAEDGTCPDRPRSAAWSRPARSSRHPCRRGCGGCRGPGHSFRGTAPVRAGSPGSGASWCGSAP